VRYTHEDLAANMWKNPGETEPDALGRDKATNGIDDDGNGLIDDRTSPTFEVREWFLRLFFSWQRVAPRVSLATLCRQLRAAVLLFC
jgi:hypothetical protein